jgi:hypothetical protein
VTIREPEWSEEDRALVLALAEERAEICPGCGNRMSECRDKRTAGTWTVETEICQPSRVAQKLAEENRETRGLHIYTRRTEGLGG